MGSRFGKYEGKASKHAEEINQSCVHLKQKKNIVITWECYYFNKKTDFSEEHSIYCSSVEGVDQESLKLQLFSPKNINSSRLWADLKILIIRKIYGKKRAVALAQTQDNSAANSRVLWKCQTELRTELPDSGL